MKRDFAVKLQQRAAQIFGVPEADIFAANGSYKSNEDRAVEEAICYVCWLRDNTPNEMGQNFGPYDYHAAMRRCCARRTESKAYSEKVGALVLAAQIGFPKQKIELAGVHDIS